MKTKLSVLLLISTLTVFLAGSCNDKRNGGLGSISLSKHGITLPANGGTFSVDVSASAGFTVESSSWIHLDSTGVTVSEDGTYSSGSYTFIVNQNTGSDNRSGSVTFRCLDAVDSIRITQNGLVDSYLEVFMEAEEPGFYSESLDDFIYEEFESQYSLSYPADGETFSYRMLTTQPAEYFTISGIPQAFEEGETYTLDFSQNFSFDMSTTSPYQFSIQKVSGEKVWMYNVDNRFGLIITTE